LAEVSIFDLIRAFQNVLKRFEEARDFGDIVDDRYTVNDKIEFLLTSLQPGQGMTLQSLFKEATSKVEVIVTFLALLELMKMNQFKAKQDNLMGQIEIVRSAAP
jgi:segregation and condensation protein A